jgi:hypothetical protein
MQDLATFQGPFRASISTVTPRPRLDSLENAKLKKKTPRKGT